MYSHNPQKQLIQLNTEKLKNCYFFIIFQIIVHFTVVSFEVCHFEIQSFQQYIFSKEKKKNWQRTCPLYWVEEEQKKIPVKQIT